RHTRWPRDWSSDVCSSDLRAVFKTGVRPNGVAIGPQGAFAIAACIGDETHDATLHVLTLHGHRQYSLHLPGRPRWCVTDAAAKRSEERRVGGEGREGRGGW